MHFEFDHVCRDRLNASEESVHPPLNPCLWRIVMLEICLECWEQVWTTHSSINCTLSILENQWDQQNIRYRTFKCSVSMNDSWVIPSFDLSRPCWKSIWWVSVSFGKDQLNIFDKPPIPPYSSLQVHEVQLIVSVLDAYSADLTCSVTEPECGFYGSCMMHRQHHSQRALLIKQI